VTVRVDGTLDFAMVTQATLGACAIARMRKERGGGEDLPNWVESIGHAAAGCAAGVASMAMIYPIDTIKTRLQLEQPALPVGKHGWELVKAMYAGVFAHKHKHTRARSRMRLLSVSLLRSCIFYFFLRSTDVSLRSTDVSLRPRWPPVPINHRMVIIDQTHK
jgi:hypothetical protein